MRGPPPRHTGSIPAKHGVYPRETHGPPRATRRPAGDPPTGVRHRRTAAPCFYTAALSRHRAGNWRLQSPPHAFAHRNTLPLRPLNPAPGETVFPKGHPLRMRPLTPPGFAPAWPAGRRARLGSLPPCRDGRPLANSAGAAAGFLPTAHRHSRSALGPSAQGSTLPSTGSQSTRPACRTAG